MPEDITYIMCFPIGRGHDHVAWDDNHSPVAVLSYILMYALVLRGKYLTHAFYLTVKMSS